MDAERYGAIVNSGHLQAPRDDFATPEAAAAWARTEAAALIAANPAGWGAEWRVHRLVGSQTALDPHPSTALLRSCDCTVSCGDDPDLKTGKADACAHLQQRRTAERVIEERQARIAELTASLGEPGDVLAALEVALESRAKLTQAATDVLAERQRQINAEGWTPEHDDCNRHRELAFAGACYAIASPDGFSDIVQWPWQQEWWKPSTPRRNLIKAGALILAEIERLDRKAATTEGGA